MGGAQSASYPVIRIEVRNSQLAVQHNRARVEAAGAAKLARQSPDAEQKKYSFGVSTCTLVPKRSTT